MTEGGMCYFADGVSRGWASWTVFGSEAVTCGYPVMYIFLQHGVKRLRDLSLFV